MLQIWNNKDIFAIELVLCKDTACGFNFRESRGLFFELVYPSKINIIDLIYFICLALAD